MTFEPVLYIIMRSDMNSMTAGKAMAQAAHAATAFEKNMAKIIEEYNTSNSEDSDINDIIELYNVWRSSTEQGFGTKIVLEATSEAKLNDMLGEADGRRGVVVDSILDPSYPVKDGSVTHLIPVTTCGFIFTDRNHWRPIGNLHP